VRDSRFQLPILLPLRVPWMVSPSTPFLRLVATESAADGGTFVEFVGYYQCDDHPSELGTDVLIAQPPGPFQPAKGIQRGAYRLIRIVFKSGVWARMTPSHSDTETIDESQYDWSQIPDQWTPDMDIDEYLDRDREAWQQTGVCPDPGVYEVSRSRWLSETGAGSDGRWKHFLITGDDSYADVIAQGYEIVEGQVLTGL
jgi:hypothetical protein